jgi:hypothetical protein
MRIAQMIGAVLLVIASPAMSRDVSAIWLVSQESGDVRVLRSGTQPASLQVHGQLVPGDVVATGSNGRAMLTRGDDYVVVAPNSRLLLPRDEQQSGFTRLVQQLGTMLYKVHHTGIPHFSVQTPMLAAVVKGTSFTVIVEQDRAAVQVTDGIVEVTSAAGQARRLVERGMTVYVGRERPDAIIEMKPGTTVPPSSNSTNANAIRVSRSGDVPLATIASLTDGLVQAVPTAPAASSKPAAQPGQPANSPSELSPSSALAAVDTAIGSTNGDMSFLSLTKPLTEIDGASSSPATQPIVDVFGNVAPTVTAPIVNTVTSTVPTVTSPIVNTVTSTVPTVTAPIVNTVTSTVPSVTAPIVNTVTSTVPTVTAPIVNTVTSTVPTVTQPVGSVLSGVGSLLGHP